MPIHGKLLMTLPFRGISETDSEFQFLPAFFPSENLSSAKRSPQDPRHLWSAPWSTWPCPPPQVPLLTGWVRGVTNVVWRINVNDLGTNSKREDRRIPVLLPDINIKRQGIFENALTFDVKFSHNSQNYF